jgi:hypothetical protein
MKGMNIPPLQKLQLPIQNMFDNKSENNSSFHRGHWSSEEDERLKEAVNNMSPVIWDVIAEQVGFRSAKQCRERWHYRLNPNTTSTPFRPSEDIFIIKERARIGNHWTGIASQLDGRSAASVKNRWYTSLRKKSEVTPQVLLDSNQSIQSLQIF